MQQTKLLDSCKPYTSNHLKGWFNVYDLQVKKGLLDFAFA